MNRRSLLGILAASPAIAAVSASPAGDDPVRKIGGRRYSCRKGDAGYREYCLARGDGKTVKVYFNGQEVRGALIADETEGMLLRIVETPAGNFAHDGKELLEETVYGDVKIVVS